MAISIEKKRGIFGILLFVFMLSFVFAASILDELHLNIQTVDGSGNVVTGTFDFDFNISTTSDCNNVIYSDSATLTTDSRGIISYYLTNVNLDYDNQYYLCHYRDDVLINNSKISRTPYAFRAKYVNTSGIEVDSNLDLSGYNFTANYLFGDGSGLTNLNVSAIDLSGYVPYTGANQNLVLGVNNFSVNTNTLFVDSSSGKIGIGIEPNSAAFSNAPLVIDVTQSGTGNAIFINDASPVRWTGGSYIGPQSSLFSLYSAGYDMTFRGYNGTDVLDILYMDKDGSFGKIGIGTETPQNALNVIGDGNFTGNVYGTFVGDGSGLTGLTGTMNSTAWNRSGTYVYLANSGDSVGIGTDNPGAPLHVTGQVNTGNIVNITGPTPRFYLTDTSVGERGWQIMTNSDDLSFLGNNGNTRYVTFKYGGNVGIGTSTPQNTLNVLGEINATGNITSQADICLETGECLSSTLSSAGNVSGSGVASQAAFWTSDDALSSDGNFTWDNSNKRLGIGTDTPTSPLHVSGNSFNAPLVVESDGGVPGLQLYNAAGNRIWIIGSRDSDSNNLYFSASPSGTSGSVVAGSSVLSIEQGGDIGIGTNNPSSKLHINGTPGALTSGLTFGDGDSGIYQVVDNQIDFAIGGTRVLRFDGAGFDFANNDWAKMMREAPSSTNPVFVPGGVNDADTGIGSAGDNQLSLIAGGAEGIRVGSTNVTSNNDVYVSGDLNATGDVCASGGCLNDVVSGNVNANSSDYWDGLDTPQDLSGSSITNDLNWINASGVVTVVGNWSADKDNYYTKTETYNQSEVDDMITSGTVNNSQYLDGYDSSYFMPLNTSVSGDFDFNGGWTGGGVSIVDGDLYAQTGYFYQINSLQVTNLDVNGSLIPDLDDSFDLGNSTRGWRDGYFTGQVTADSFVGDGSGLTGLPAGSKWNVSSGNIYPEDLSYNVGIGTDSPSAILEVESELAPEIKISPGSDVSVDPTLYLSDTSTSNGFKLWYDNSNGRTYFDNKYNNDNGDMIFRTKVDSSAITAFVIKGTGDVGIGTTTPQRTLHVNGDILSNATINATGDICIEGGQCLSNVVSSAGNVSGVGVDNYVPLWNGVDELESSVIYQNETTGFVGIGTTSPTDKLSVYDGRVNIREMTASDYAVVEFGNDQAALTGGFFLAGSTASGYGGPNSMNLINLGSGPVALGTNNGVDFLIEDGGNVGIGTDNPSSKLEIYSTSSGGYKINISGGDAANTITSTHDSYLDLRADNEGTRSSEDAMIRFYSSTYSAPRWVLGLDNSDSDKLKITNGEYKPGVESSDLFTFTSLGNFGIGTTSPAQKLDVNGSIVAGTDSSILIGSNARIRAVGTSDDYLYLEANGNGATRVNYLYGSGGFEVYNGTGSNLVFDVSGTGNVTAQTDVCLETGECLSNSLSSAGNVSGSGAANRAAFWTSNDQLSYDDDFVWDNTNKRLGVGVTNPLEELHVNGSLMLSDNTVSMENITFDAETSVGMRLTNPNGYVSITPLNVGWAHIYTDRARYIFNTDMYVIGGRYASYSTADLTLSAGGTRNDLTIDNDNGNIGIGDETPEEKLTVSGSAKVTGSMIIGTTNITTEANGDVQVW